jgi:hypothetical protein
METPVDDPFPAVDDPHAPTKLAVKTSRRPARTTGLLIGPLVRETVDRSFGRGWGSRRSPEKPSRPIMKGES